MGYIIGIDFDGTVVTHMYPEVGKDIGAVPVLKRLVDCGNKLILFTMRDSKNGTLQDAINWFKENGIELYGVNTNPSQASWTDSPKAHCHIYIDDAGLATPTKYDVESGREYVDWVKVEQILDRKFGAFDDDFDFEEEEDNNEINESKKMGKIKITENKLKSLIAESTRKVLNEISWQKAQDAAEMAEDNDVFDKVLWKLEDALSEFDEAFDRYNSMAYAGGKMQRNSGVMKYFKETEKVRYFKEKLQQLYNEMNAYHDRKINQSKNLEQMADDRFKETHNGMSYSEYENTLPDYDEEMTPEQEEYMKHLYGR